MGFFPDLKEWRVVRFIKKSDAVEGGLNGAANAPIEDLANRTGYLKQEQDKLKTDLQNENNKVLKQSDLEDAETSILDQISALEKKSFVDRGALGTKDLNDVFSPGRYTQGAGSGSSIYLTKNYPLAQGGELFVSNWASGNNVIHTYISISGDVLVRYYYDARKTWYKWGNNAAKSTHQIELYYDNEQHSQSSLNAKQDMSDVSKSEWVILPAADSKGVRAYIEPLKVTKVYTTYCYSNEPGYYQSPKYAEDKNRTMMQFVIANDTTTSAQINAELSKLEIEPPICGGWWDGARVYDAIALRFAGLHPYSRLWVRFINTKASQVSDADYFKQSVLTHGGNSSLKVNRVVQYPKLPQQLDQFKK